MSADTVVVAATVVATAAVGGVFLAFDTFVMAGLARLPEGQGADAMRSVNVTAVRVPFMIAFVGAALLSVAVVVLGFVSDDGAERLLLILGGAAYLLGTFVLTIARNVPLNDALEASEGATWPTYLRAWIAANHVRTASSLAASVLLLVAVSR
jgi:uncharacterized membrane protein